MATYHASVELDAPVRQVYEFFSHFTDFPKFIDFVEAITYHDRLRSNWVAEIVGKREWVALSEQWIADQAMAWRATDDTQTMGKIEFAALHPQQTRLTVVITNHAKSSDDTGELLGTGRYIEHALQYDLKQFALVVNQSTARFTDPESPLYLLQETIVLTSPDAGNPS